MIEMLDVLLAYTKRDTKLRWGAFVPCQHWQRKDVG